GSVDEDFGTDGKTIIDVLGDSKDDFGRGVAIQSDQSIVVAGYAYDGSRRHIAIVRLDSAGDLDTDFSDQGKAISSAVADDTFVFGFAVQGDGKYVVSGDAAFSSDHNYAFAARFTTDGDLDSSFANHPILAGVSSDRAYAVAEQ